MDQDHTPERTGQRMQIMSYYSSGDRGKNLLLWDFLLLCRGAEKTVDERNKPVLFGIAADMKLTIIGASGHGRVIADMALLNNYHEIEFLDDNPDLTECGGFPVTGPSGDCRKKDNDVIIGIGNTAVRKKLSEKYAGMKIPVLIHPCAVVSDKAEIGRGTVVMAGSVINPGAVIGSGCIINTCSSVDHDCILGDYVHVAVGAHVCGNVYIGSETWIGAGSTVINNVRICPGCIIGAGAVVISDITEPGTYVGVPAKLLKK